ncbi:MAG: hypothetical protein WC610_02240 [Patescibacteria group bacterium]
MENLENEKIEKGDIEKPRILYHASINRGLPELNPADKSVRDRNEGPVVFATPDRALVTTFLVEGHDDSWTRIGIINGVHYMVICRDRDKFIELDKGGSIYEFPSEEFYCDPAKGMGEKEWASKKTVKPINEVSYPSALDAMIESGVQVYFVDRETFQSIDLDSDYGTDFKKITSENQRRGVNIIPFNRNDDFIE